MEKVNFLNVNVLWFSALHHFTSPCWMEPSVPAISHVNEREMATGCHLATCSCPGTSFTHRMADSFVECVPALPYLLVGIVKLLLFFCGSSLCKQMTKKN